MIFLLYLSILIGIDPVETNEALGVCGWFFGSVEEARKKPAFCVGETTAAVWRKVGGWIPFECSASGFRHRWLAAVHAGKFSGRGPGRNFGQLLLIPFCGCLYRLDSKPVCDGDLLGVGFVAEAGSAGAGDGWSWWISSSSRCWRSGGFIVFFVFSRDLFAPWVEQLSVSLYDVPVYVRIAYSFLNY
jgi:hypothetical protein